jgi:predicted nucleotidyltransferase
MHKLWLKKPKLDYSENVVDIVQYGSSVRGGTSPNDIDIAVIFNKIQIKDQLNESQNIKKQLSKTSNIPIHIKSFDLYSLFDKSNFARESIIFYGISILKRDYFSKIFGLMPKIHIFYSLNKLKKKDKIRFNYLLNGRGGKYGMLKKYKGRLVKPGMVEISPEYEKIFEDSIKKQISSFIIKKIFLLI